MSQLLQSFTLQGQTAAPHNHPTPCRATSPLAVPMEPPAYITNHQLTNGVTLHNTSGATSFLTANGVGSTHKFRVAVDSHVPRKATHAPSHQTLHWPVDLTANGRTYSTCWVPHSRTTRPGPSLQVFTVVCTCILSLRQEDMDLPISGRVRDSNCRSRHLTAERCQQHSWPQWSPGGWDTH